jgi:2-amino-4-hydroxy-6-hydroxymethyldihydropteridine diphosphokinase
VWKLREHDKVVKRKNTAIVLIGSNISPEANVKLGIEKLSAWFPIIAVSSTWETASIGTHGPNFLNLAISFQTELNPEDLKFHVLRKIEQELGRVRTGDKYAPRPMDLDIIIYNGKVIDVDIWERAFIALPISELTPGLVHPMTKESITIIAQQLQRETFAIVRSDLKIEI